MHLQRSGHKPYVLVGGATGMVGDPSGKKSERQLLDLETINHNLGAQLQQLTSFLDFETGENKAEVVNNYDWFKDVGFLEFIRDVGKHISVSYMIGATSSRCQRRQPDE
jgi:tyrosyl-tRNA synthetase